IRQPGGVGPAMRADLGARPIRPRAKEATSIQISLHRVVLSLRDAGKIEQDSDSQYILPHFVPLPRASAAVERAYGTSMGRIASDKIIQVATLERGHLGVRLGSSAAAQRATKETIRSVFEPRIYSTGPRFRWGAKE